MDSNSFTNTAARSAGAFVPSVIPQIVAQIDYEPSHDAELKALLSKIENSSGLELIDLVNELAQTGSAHAVRPLLKLFAGGEWEVLWTAHKGLLENFNAERATVSAARLLKEIGSELPLLNLVSEPIFFKCWEELEVTELIQLYNRLAQLSVNPEVRDRSLYDGLYYLSVLYGGKQNSSKFSASMNKRDCELHQLQFIYSLTEPDSLCRTEAISFLLESVSPGTSLLPKNRAKVGLKNVAQRSGIALLTHELTHGTAMQKQQSAQLLGRLKNTKTIPTLLEAFSKGDPNLRSTIKAVLDRYFSGVYEWYQTDIVT